MKKIDADVTMRRVLKKCAIVGLVAATMSAILFSWEDGISVVVGAGLMLANLWAFSKLFRWLFSKPGVQTSAPKSKLFLFGIAIVLKLLILFTGVAAACYYLQPLFVVVGLLTFIVGITWEGVDGLFNKKVN